MRTDYDFPGKKKTFAPERVRNLSCGILLLLPVVDDVIVRQGRHTKLLYAGVLAHVLAGVTLPCGVSFGSQNVGSL